MFAMLTDLMRHFGAALFNVLNVIAKANHWSQWRSWDDELKARAPREPTLH